jgi:hypothetical protein
MELARAIEDDAHSLIGRRPNVDFSTVVLRRSFGLPPESALALTGVARSAGWIAHVIEQYAANRLIRPRARYAGPRESRKSPHLHIAAVLAEAATYALLCSVVFGFVRAPQAHPRSDPCCR